MGYLHIDNLYKAQEILAFRRCFAMEKIHGTSAHVSWNGGKVGFFSGGESYPRFCALFDADALAARFAERFVTKDVVLVHGEAYGGKQQGMSKTYGKDLRFIAFDVKVGDSWLAVPQALDLATHLGLDFVAFEEISTDLEVIDAERDKPSVQAVRNGVIDEPRIREGIVLRPPFEVVMNNGRRVIAKHKRPEFAERESIPNVDPAKRVLMESADAIATEWVTPMRLEHVIDALLSSRDDKDLDIRDTGKIIELMVEDVTREAAGEIAESSHIKKACGARAAKLFKAHLAAALHARVTED